MDEFDQRLLTKWLRLIARIRETGAITEERADELRSEAVAAVSDIKALSR